MSWNQGLFNCCGDFKICLCGTFCVPCLLCQNAQDLGKSGLVYNVLGRFVKPLLPAPPLSLALLSRLCAALPPHHAPSVRRQGEVRDQWERGDGRSRVLALHSLCQLSDCSPVTEPLVTTRQI